MIARHMGNQTFSYDLLIPRACLKNALIYSYSFVEIRNKLLKEILKLSASAWMTKFTKCLRLNLSDTLSCYVKFLTNEEIAKKMNMPVAKIDEILKTSRDPVSLDTPIGEEEDSQLGDFIEDESLLSPVDSASFSMLKEELEEAMASLTERERNVIKLRFGLDVGKTRTLEEVGKEFNVTRERIRQIEA